MIIYYRNNPSILIWEIGNQLIPENVSQTIISYIQRYDHGNRTYITSNGAGDYNYNNTEIKQNSGTYNETTTDNVRMAGVRKGTDLKMVPYVDIGITTEGGGGMNTNTYGKKPEVEGEYNRLEARRGVWDKFTTGYENFTNDINSSRDQGYIDVTSQEFAIYQVSSYIDMISRTNHCGGANWIFSDSISHGRIGSEVARASGEVDATMLPKESYWVTKVIFSDTESAHIIGHWNYPIGTQKNVYAVANCSTASQATLVVTNLNGISTEYTGSRSDNYLWTFENVNYEEGTVRVDIKNIEGVVKVTDSITSHGAPAELKLTPIINNSGLQANGSDYVLVDVELLDSNGNRCESFNGEIENIYTYFTVNNQTSTENSDDYCIWRGGYNSGIEHSINKKNLYLEAGITRVALRTTMNPGAITVTGTMTLENSVTLTDSCTVNSMMVDNTNGYSPAANNRLTYVLDGITPTTIGDATKPIEEGVITETFSSSLVESVSYTGSLIENWSLEEVLENGGTVYSDSDVTFNSVPYKYLNAEYLKLPSADNGVLALDLINFSASKNIDVLVFRDINVENPSWLDGYTLTNDIVTTSDGQVYMVYKKSIMAGTGITIGGNGDTAEIGTTGAMNIIAFKETTKIEDEVFFAEDFRDSNGASYFRGWQYSSGVNTEIIPEIFATENSNGVIETSNTIHLKDYNKSGYALINKRFAAQSDKVRISYKMYINNVLNENTIINKFIRTFLHCGPALSEINDKSKTLTEIYLDGSTNNNSDYVYAISRTAATGTDNTNIKTNIPVNTWHTFEYEVNIPDGNFTAKVDNVSTGGTYSLYNNVNTYADYIIIGTGNASENNVYVTDIEVEPIASTAITGITVNDVAIQEFNVLTKDYFVRTRASSIPNIEINKRDQNVTSTITLNEDNTIATITVVDGSTTLNYTIYIDSEYINTTELRSLISYVNGLDGDCYTLPTWGNLQTEFIKAQTVLDSVTATTIDVQMAVINLKQKIRELKIDSVAVQNKYY